MEQNKNVIGKLKIKWPPSSYDTSEPKKVQKTPLASPINAVNQKPEKVEKKPQPHIDIKDATASYGRLTDPLFR